MEETNKDIDLGTLTLYDSNAIPIGENQQQIQANITQAMVQNVKFIFTKIIQAKKDALALIQSLPQQQQIHDFSQSKLYLKLPQGTLVFPRSYKLPEKKGLSKWEKFAKQKGIKKRKRTGLAYDPTLKTQVARWGKNSKKNFQPAIMQEKVYGRNPFDDVKKTKKLNRQKQSLKQIKNKERRMG